MATPNVERTIGPGTRVDLSISGSLPTYLPDGIFRERLIDQVTMQGLRVLNLTISSGYGLTSRDYTAALAAAPLAQSHVATIVGQVRTALEYAGSYSPVITVPAVGEPEQPKITPSMIESAVTTVINATAKAAENVADSPKDFFRGVNVIVIGIVVLAALVAFGPNIKDVARAAR